MSDSTDTSPLEFTATKLDECIQILDQFDVADARSHFVSTSENKQKEEEEFDSHFDGYFNQTRFLTSSVLGIDIYRYSSFPEKKQRYVPLVFRQLYDSTVASLLGTESSFFGQYTPDRFWKDFVPTGDGGFQILPTPLHCLIFSVYFEANLRRFNSFKSYPRLRNHLGEISLRYAVTYDKLMSFDENFFGPGIIKNARIMSKDKLNRLLVDAETYEWFLNRFNGVETLTAQNYLRILEQFNLPKGPDGKYQSVVFGNTNSFKNVSIQKLGQLAAKESKLDVYSLFVQVALTYGNQKTKTDRISLVVSVGNTNSSGLND